MKKSMKKKAALPLSAAMLLCVVLSGCAPGQKNGGSVTPSDAAVSDAEPLRVGVGQAVEISVDGQKHPEVFLMQYNWYGEEFDAKDSLNKTMMEQYVSEEKHAPFAVQKAPVSITFAPSEGIPSQMTLTQYGNTVLASSALGYDTLEPELEQTDGNTFSFKIDFRSFKMYYYLLICEWENGNKAQYAFAVEMTY